jgi:chromosome segregation ATPase
MSKNNIIIALIVLCFLGIIWGSVQNKKSSSMERQLVAMREGVPVATTDGHAAVADAHAATNDGAEAKSPVVQGHSAQAANLKGSVENPKEEGTAQKKGLAESNGPQSTEAMQAQLDEQSAAMTKLEESLAAAKAELETKSSALAAATEASAGCDELKSTLANSVDTYSAKSQELAAEVEECSLRVGALDKALDERTKLLVGAGEELARTKLNMNVLLSKIGAQNNSLEILEETRIALEKELAVRSMVGQQLDGPIVEDVVIVGEVDGEAEPEVVVEENAGEAEAVVEENADEAEEAPAK